MVELDGPLTVDLDTADDLVFVESDREPNGRVASVSADASVRVLALDGIPEIREGDDLGVFIANAIQRTRGALPLAADDVMVVTQKIVSKAEGAVVDLTTVEPRPEAIEFAERYDRDPRQVEVVLREARRVVRMTNGVLITETRARVRVRQRRRSTRRTSGPPRARS